VAEAQATLVRRHWLEGEARERGIAESETGQPLRAELLQAAINAQIAEPAARSVTPDQVKAYVDANPQVVPETRTARVIITKSRRRAAEVLRRLERGAKWSSLGATKETFERADDTATSRAVFRARLNRTLRRGRLVFRVIRDAPSRPEPRAQQEARAWEVLASQAQERALNEFRAQFTAKWRERTRCAPEYGQHEDCAPPPSGQETP
jgi:hypothetical protein